MTGSQLKEKLGARNKVANYWGPNGLAWGLLSVLSVDVAYSLG